MYLLLLLLLSRKHFVCVGIVAYLVGGGGGDAETKRALEAVSEEEKEAAFLDAALACSFVPVVKALLAFRRATTPAFVQGAYHIRRGWNAFSFAQSFADHMQHSSPDPMTLGLIAFALGSFQFVLSLVPPTFKWIRNQKIILSLFFVFLLVVIKYFPHYMYIS
jgi:hypothetical protein